MYANIDLREPIFEIGPKAYLHGKAALDLALAADRMACEYGVTIVFTPQYVDIPMIASQVKHLHVFSQHCDPIAPGIGIGSILAEALKEAGAKGTLLNHSERRMTLSDIRQTIERTDEVGLATMICADSPEEAAAIAQLHPNVILAEPPSLIGTDQSVGESKEAFIGRFMDAVRAVDTNIKVLCSAGIRSGEDVAKVMRMNVSGSGSTSGIIKAENPIEALEDMIRALKTTWSEMNP